MKVNPAGIWNCIGANTDAGSDNGAWSSPEGDVWTHRTTPVGGTGGVSRYHPYSLAWDPDLSQFLALFANNSFDFRTTTNAGEANWAFLGAAHDDQIPSGAVYTGPGGQFIAMTDDDFGNLLGLSSPDGDPWTVRNSFDTGGLSFTQKADYGNGVYVGTISHFGGGDLSLTIVTSTDGITFTVRDTPLSNNLLSVAYNTGTGTWCAVGVCHGSPNRAEILTATDPTSTWTDRSPLFPGGNAGALNDITSFPGGFLAVGLSSDNKARIMSSVDDGITWAEETDHPKWDVADWRYDCIDYHPSGKICIAGGRPASINTSKVIVSN